MKISTIGVYVVERTTGPIGTTNIHQGWQNVRINKC
jgi:hypothetical protein